MGQFEDSVDVEFVLKFHLCSRKLYVSLRSQTLVQLRMCSGIGWLARFLFVSFIQSINQSSKQASNQLINQSVSQTSVI